MILVSCPHSSSESYIVFWYIMQNDYYSKGGPTSVRLAVCEKKLKRKTMKLSWGGATEEELIKDRKWDVTTEKECQIGHNRSI